MSGSEGARPNFISPAEHARRRHATMRRRLLVAGAVFAAFAAGLAAVFYLPKTVEVRRLARLSKQIAATTEGQVQTSRFTANGGKTVEVATERWRNRELWLERPEAVGVDQTSLPAFSDASRPDEWSPAFQQLARLIGRAANVTNLRYVSWSQRTAEPELTLVANGSQHVVRFDSTRQKPVRWEIRAREGSEWRPVLLRVFGPLDGAPVAERQIALPSLEVERLPSRRRFSDERLAFDVRDVSVNGRGGIYVLVTGRNLRFVLFTLKDGLGRSYIHVLPPDDSFNEGANMDAIRALYFAPLEPSSAKPQLPLRLALRRYRPGMVDRTPFLTIDLPDPTVLAHLAPEYQSVRFGRSVADQRVLLNEALTRQRVLLGLLRDREGTPILSPMDTNVGPDRLRKTPEDAMRALVYLEESRWRLLERSWEADWRPSYWEGRFWALRRTDRQESARVARQMALDAGATGVTDDGSELLGDPAPFLYGPVRNFPMRP